MDENEEERVERECVCVCVCVCVEREIENMVVLVFKYRVLHIDLINNIYETFGNDVLKCVIHTYNIFYNLLLLLPCC